MSQDDPSMGKHYRNHTSDSTLAQNSPDHAKDALYNSLTDHHKANDYTRITVDPQNMKSTIDSISLKGSKTAPFVNDHNDHEQQTHSLHVHNDHLFNLEGDHHDQDNLNTASYIKH